MQSKGSRWTWGVILIATSGRLAAADLPCDPGQTTEVHIGPRHWQVEVADTDAKRVQGLSGRPRLAPDAGMLFLLPEPGFYGFWMKDMAFPIDLAWITPQKRVAAVETLAPCPPDTCSVHFPTEPVSWVLEVLADTLPVVEDQEPPLEFSWICRPAKEPDPES